MWVYAATLLALVASSAAPSPLYPIYQAAWQLSPFIVTVIFAAYVGGLLLTLVIAGSISDFLGRKPIALLGILAAIVAMVLFAFADSSATLIAGRLVQGFAVGLSMGVLGAGMIDNQPSSRPTAAGILNGIIPPLGLAVGALGSGLLVQFAGAPRTTVYLVIAAVLLVAGVAIALVRERMTRRSGAMGSLVPSLAVPAPSRRVFASVVGALVAAWAFSAFYLAFSGAVLHAAYGISSPTLTGLSIALLSTVASITGFVGRKVDPGRMMAAGLIALAVASAGVVAAITLGIFPLFLLAGAVGGFGFGAAFPGALRLLLSTAPAEGRSGLLSAVYVVSYLGLGLPAIIAGIFVPAGGLIPVLSVYGALVALVALIVLVLRRFVPVAPRLAVA
jgi:MFS family permease